MSIDLNLNDIVRLRVACYTSSQVGINTGHFFVSALAGTSRTLQQVAEAFDATMAPRYKAAIATQARYRGASAQRVHPGGVTLSWPSVINDGVGSGAGGMMATQVAGLCSAQTNLAGARFRGRVYIPFPSEDFNDSDADPTVAYLALLSDIAEEWYTAFTVAGGGNSVTLEPCVFHRDLNAMTPIVQYLVRTNWATQRRRGGFGQQNTPPF